MHYPLLMAHYNLFLASSLPASWIVGGGLLIAVTLVAVLLFIIKYREVAGLKKEIEELRDTIRMMRYEEANLSRMLHTADKPAFPEAHPTPEPPIEEKNTEEEDIQKEEDITEEKIIIEESNDKEEAPEENEVAEDVVSPKDPKDAENPEDTEAKEDLEESEDSESPIDSEDNEDAETSEDAETYKPEPEESETTEEPVEESIPEVRKEEIPRKQGINERRPAIPNDLFAAWFEENDRLEQQQNEAEAAVSPTDELATIAEKEPCKLVAEDMTECPAEVAATVATEQSTTQDPAETSAPAEGTDQPTAPNDMAEQKVMSKEDERFCRKLERIVTTRMRNPNLNIDIIAAQFGMGRTNFYRKVRELMGMSPNDYLRKCRMERAAQLLLSTEHTVAEIGEQVGIPDAQYFSRVFKGYYETTPSAYREQQQEI